MAKSKGILTSRQYQRESRITLREITKKQGEPNIKIKQKESLTLRQEAKKNIVNRINKEFKEQKRF